MEQIDKKVYMVKNILLGYITTINPNSYTNEDQIIKTVLPFKIEKISYHEKRIVPISKFFPYYSIDELVPLNKKIKKKSKWISGIEIKELVEKEKVLQYHPIKKVETTPTIQSLKNCQKVLKIENELDINKNKRYVV